jgi:hypothetical protein
MFPYTRKAVADNQGCFDKTLLDEAAVEHARRLNYELG